MTTPLHIFRTYASSAAAEPLLTLLDQHHIPYETRVDTGQPAFDPTFAYNAPYAQLIVLIRSDDIAVVTQLEDQLNAQLISQVAPDHYLFTFSDEELLDVVTEPDSWSSFDVELATQLLQKREVRVSADAQTLRSSMPPPRHTMQRWLVVGRVLMVLIGLAALYRFLHALL